MGRKRTNNWQVKDEIMTEIARLSHTDRHSLLIELLNLCHKNALMDVTQEEAKQFLDKKRESEDNVQSD